MIWRIHPGEVCRYGINWETSQHGEFTELRVFLVWRWFRDRCGLRVRICRPKFKIFIYCLDCKPEFGAYCDRHTKGGQSRDGAVPGTTRRGMFNPSCPLHIIRLLASWACVAASGAVAAWTRFTNPDLTETRLLIEFWPNWLAVIAAGVTAVVLARAHNIPSERR